jgi:dinuclear metal center YbgI/SA1388 family protein
MTLAEFTNSIHTVLLPATAMQGDPIGTQVASSSGIVSTVLTCMEITDAVIDEAIAGSCDTIVTFHPLIYVPLKALAGQDRVAKLVARLIREDISVVSVHTMFDAFPQGTNAILANKLGLQDLRPLQAAALSAESPAKGYGMGLLGAYSGSFPSLITRVGEFSGGPVKYSAPVRETIETVAIVAGSGMSFFQQALQAGADVFITADVKYHDFHAATDVIGIIDPGHFEMEQFVPEGMISPLSLACPDCTFRASTVRTSPVHYHVPQHIHRH